MKVLVAIKRVPDYKTVIRLKADGSEVETANVKMSVNPFDEIAVEAAVQLKEQNKASEVVVVSIGSDAVQESLRAMLALGADRAVCIKHEGQLTPLKTAQYLKKLVEQERPNCVILGKQAIDSDDNQVGQMLAGLLNWSQGTFASKIVVDNGKVHVTREIDGGLETLLLSLPTVITTDLRLNEPRYLSLPNIMKAKTKRLDVIAASDLLPPSPDHIRTVSVAMPEKKRAGLKVETVAELVKKLKEEAKVL